MTLSDKAKKWVAESRNAADCWNKHVEKHGLPLAQFINLWRERKSDVPPIGAIKSFGLVGPKYEVGNPLRQLDDGDWTVEITLIESGEKTEYRLSNINDDPEAA